MEKQLDVRTKVGEYELVHSGSCHFLADEKNTLQVWEISIEILFFDQPAGQERLIKMGFDDEHDVMSLNLINFNDTQMGSSRFIRTPILIDDSQALYLSFSVNTLNPKDIRLFTYSFYILNATINAEI